MPNLIMLVLEIAAIYFIVGIVVGLYISKEDFKRYGDNRYLNEDILVFLFLGAPVVLTMISALIMNTGESLCQKAKKNIFKT